MDPTALPIELFVQILQYLPRLYTWRLRSTGKRWNDVLSTSFVVFAALQGQDLDSFKRAPVSKPVSCMDLKLQKYHVNRSVDFHGRHFACMTHDRSGVGYELVLHIQDIEGAQEQLLNSWTAHQRKHLRRRGVRR